MRFVKSAMVQCLCSHADSFTNVAGIETVPEGMADLAKYPNMTLQVHDGGARQESQDLPRSDKHCFNLPHSMTYLWIRNEYKNAK